jgi:D-glycero-alpha-D-manno-heptose-7-phosphate kinase
VIISRSPLRISIGGGGTDLPSYYREHGGFVIAAAIDRYVYVSVMRPFAPGIFLKYSELEKVAQAADVKHPIMREALRMMAMHEPQIEITTLADVPAGTGLGSSGSFTTALLKALHAFEHRAEHPAELAEQACDIEINRLAAPVGKQDQYIAAFGGITAFTFHADERVDWRPLRLSPTTRVDLEENLLLFFTGYTHSAAAVLREQDTRTREHDPAVVENLHRVRQQGLEIAQLLEAGRCEDFGALMNEQWRKKKERSSGASNPRIDRLYELGCANGAVGGKLVGAGGGGFLLFYASDRARLRHTMAEAELEELRFRFDLEGTKLVMT